MRVHAIKRETNVGCPELDFGADLCNCFRRAEEPGHPSNHGSAKPGSSEPAFTFRRPTRRPNATTARLQDEELNAPSSSQPVAQLQINAADPMSAIPADTMSASASAAQTAPAPAQTETSPEIEGSASQESGPGKRNPALPLAKCLSGNADVLQQALLNQQIADCKD